jgi:hypothetical protein
MSGLMLHEKLLTSEHRDAVRDVARTVTLAALRRLEEPRKTEVVHFLYEAELLSLPARPPPARRLFKSAAATYSVA